MGGAPFFLAQDIFSFFFNQVHLTGVHIMCEYMPFEMNTFRQQMSEYYASMGLALPCMYTYEDSHDYGRSTKKPLTQSPKLSFAQRCRKRIPITMHRSKSGKSNKAPKIVPSITTGHNPLSPPRIANQLSDSNEDDTLVLRHSL